MALAVEMRSAARSRGVVGDVLGVELARDHTKPESRRDRRAA
jgi:hypothetical protein